MKKAHFFTVAILMAVLFWLLRDNQVAMTALNVITAAVAMNMAFYGYMIGHGRPFAAWMAGSDGAAMAWASLIWASAAANLSHFLIGAALFVSAVFLLWQTQKNASNAIAD